MHVINHTNIPVRIIHYFLRDLGIMHSKGTLVIELTDCSGRGVCKARGNTYTIGLSDISLSTLAHELKHVEQHASGLSVYMRLERELTPYKERWHEVEARQYAMAWEGKRI